MSHTYFPYDSLTLYGLKRFFQLTNNAKEFAFYSYLLGLRNHDAQSLEQALNIYIALKDKKKAIKITEKLINEYAPDQNKLTILRQYKEYLGKL